MNKFATSVLLIAGVALFNGCGGDDKTPSPQQPGGIGEFENCRVIRTDRQNFDSHLYEYDQQGRIVKHTFSDREFEVSYNANGLVARRYYKGKLTSTENVAVNSAGLASSVEIMYENARTPKKFIDFEYNAEGKLFKKTEKDEGDTHENHTVYQWYEGNMVAESKPDLSRMTKYTYNNNLVQPAEWFGSNKRDRGYEIIRNRNRVRSIEDPDGVIYSHAYSEDDSGLIMSITISPSGGNPYTKRFTYDCD